MTIWNDASFLAKIATWVPYVFIAMGAAIAMAGLSVKNKVDDRVRNLHELEQATLRNTPPEFDVFLARSEPSGRIVIVINTTNLIPFTARWHVLTKNNALVSGLLLETPEIRPTKPGERISWPVTIQDAKVVDDYLELHFSFQSVYFEIEGRPDHLKGEITKFFTYKNGRISYANGSASN